MLSLVSSWFGSSTTAPSTSTPPPPSSNRPTAADPAHAERNRKKRLAKKRAKQRKRRESTLTAPGSDDHDDDDDDDVDEGDEPGHGRRAGKRIPRRTIEADEEYPDADDDLSYFPTEPDDVSLRPSATAPSRVPRPPASSSSGSSSGERQPSTIPPEEVLAALSRLPRTGISPGAGGGGAGGGALPNNPRTKRTIIGQGFVPVEDEDGGLHIGVRVREGVVAVMGKDGPLLFGM
ncbi:hypothetical protein JCM10212_007057 [Sporobolomyces blumeae]